MRTVHPIRNLVQLRNEEVRWQRAEGRFIALAISNDGHARAGSARVPPLFLQPLVENAVKHGVEPSASGAQVRITTQRRGGIVVIQVTNTVPAGQGPRGHGVAQRNVRERLRLLHDVQTQFQASLQDGQYVVRMEVPA